MSKITQIKLIVGGVETIYDLGCGMSVGDYGDGDFAISDMNGNSIVIFHDGHVKTKNFDSTQMLIRIQLEGGSIDNKGIESYSISDFFNNSRSSYFIDVQGAGYCKFGNSYQLYMYNESHTYIGVLNCTANQIVPLKTGTKYIRLSTGVAGIEEDVVVFYGATKMPSEVKKWQQRTWEDGGTGHEIDKATNRSEKITFRVSEGICTTARLMLPPNYSINGEKVPLALWDSCDGDFINWTTHEIGEYHLYMTNGLRYLRDSGFAVLEIYSWGSDLYQKYGGHVRAAQPVPIGLLTHEMGVKYVLDRYNIDECHVFHLSKSGSGKLALWYALEKPSFNLQAIYAMAPVMDDLNFRSFGGIAFRRELFEELNLKGTDQQVNEFINGTPAEYSYTGTRWMFSRPPMDSEGENPNGYTEGYKAMIVRNQDFIANNFDKFTKMAISWGKLVGQTATEKLRDTLVFSQIFWSGIKPLDTEPANWETSYTNYYRLVRYQFLKVDDAEAPDFNSETFYEFGVYQKSDDELGNLCYNRYDLAMIGCGIPFMVLMAKNDEQTPYWQCKQVVAQLRNGGCEASIVTYNSGGHSAPDIGFREDVMPLYGESTISVPTGWRTIVLDILTRFLNKRVSAPSISVSEGSAIIASPTSGASIYYTTDGTAPTSASTLYTGAFAVTEGTTVKAIGIKSGLVDSIVTEKSV